jgi:hypothetical protein
MNCYIISHNWWLRNPPEDLKKGTEIHGRPKFSGTGWIARGLPESRRMTAILAVSATLFQAMLFAWHHHSPTFSLRKASSVALAATTGQGSPAAADHDCEICFGLSHHHGAVPVDLFGTTALEQTPPRDTRIEAVVGSVAAYLLFHPRAPPLA